MLIVKFQLRPCY